MEYCENEHIFITVDIRAKLFIMNIYLLTFKYILRVKSHRFLCL